MQITGKCTQIINLLEFTKTIRIQDKGKEPVQGFLYKFITFIDFPISSHVFPANTKMVVWGVVGGKH